MGARRIIKFFFIKIATVTLTLPQILDHEFVKDIATLNICVKFYQNLSINKVLEE